jgi:NYN domain-containing protein
VRINVYVDGFNLYYGCLKGRPYKWLDLERMCGLLLRRFEVGRIRYFTAHVKERPENLQAPVRQQAYLRALGSLPSVEIHYGSFLTKPTRMLLANPPNSGPRTVEVIKTEEKGSDVNLATYLLVDAFRDDAEAFAVVSNDSDLTEPIRIVRHELGKVVGLLNPQPVPSQRLMLCRPTFAKQIRAGVLGASQLPARVVDGSGAVIRKPAGW